MRRNRRIRVSVRQQTETKSAQGTQIPTWSHLRWQTLLSLVPLSGREMLKADRMGYEADWTASAWAIPALNTNQRVVYFVRKADETTVERQFRIQRVFPRGRKQQVLLKEEPERAKPDG